MEHENCKVSESVWAKYRPSEDNRQALFYRYEGEGVVVYDSSARIFDEPSNNSVKLEKNVVGLRKKVEIADTEEYDLSQYLNMKKYPAMRTFHQEYTLVIPEDSLRFDSRFESGNLKKAIRVNEKEYNLLLEYDVETKGYTQWFYFAVTGCKAQTYVRFNIINLMKFESLYNSGMKPLVYSEKQPEKGWHRDCSAISYFKNLTPRTARGPGHYFYTLTFTYFFKYSNDKVYFAYCYPFTYAELQDYLNGLKHPHSDYLRIDTLCHSLAGVPCQVLTITSNISTYYSWDYELNKLKKSAAGRKFLRMREVKQKSLCKRSEEHDMKKCIVLTSRVHPGESNGSYMMKGAIDFLLGDSREAKILRRKFVFKVIPMLNPDGVIYGNYRCSLLGVDLNRRWKRPNKVLHPEIYYCKRLIQMMAEEREVMLYCDMHGHSIKKDVFMYGCRDTENKKQDVFIRIIPYLLSKKNRIFSYKQCVFRVNKDKVSTGRVVCFTDIGILASYTMEASFYGPSSKSALDNKEPTPNESNSDCHMNTSHLESIGRDFCKQLLSLINTKEFNKQLRRVSQSLQEPSPIKKSGEFFITPNTPDTEIDENEDTRCYIKNMIDGIDENTLNELFSDQNEISDGESDSEGSDNDDKRLKFKHQKIFRKNKQTIKQEKSLNVLDSGRQKKLRKSISGVRATSESPKDEFSNSIINRSGKLTQNYGSVVRDQPIYRLLTRTPDIKMKQPMLSKVQNNINGFRQGLKFAAAVKLPKESTLFKSGIHQKLKSLQERKMKLERPRDKSEFSRTKVKFKEVMISMVENFQHRNTYSEFFK